MGNSTKLRWFAGLLIVSGFALAPFAWGIAGIVMMAGAGAWVIAQERDYAKRRKQ